MTDRKQRTIGRLPILTIAIAVAAVSLILAALTGGAAFGSRCRHCGNHAKHAHATRRFDEHRRIRRDREAAIRRTKKWKSWGKPNATAPVDISLPSISGSAIEGTTLSSSPGSWTGTEPISYSYQWQREGLDVAGAASSSYTLTPLDVGHEIDVVVTASNSAGSSSATSFAVPVVAAQPSPEPTSSPETAPTETTTTTTTTTTSTETTPPPTTTTTTETTPTTTTTTETTPTSTTTTPEPEPTPTPTEGSVVNANPTGPPQPSGGWHVVFADGFGTKLGYGTGEDNFWFLNKQEPANSYESGLNSNELEVFNSSAVKTGSEGLELLETYSPNAGGTGKNYVGGLVTTSPHATGQHPFAWKSGGPTTWAFECFCKWPHNTGEADPGWWSDASVNGVENEIDFFEGFGWGSLFYSTGDQGAAMPTVVGMGTHCACGVIGTLGFDPTLGYHRYTTTETPNGSKTIISEYVDGAFKWSFEVEYPANRDTFTHLILSYALREYSENFKEGTRAFDIRSVAVYQDGAHAGQEIEGGGIAPGTVVK